MQKITIKKTSGGAVAVLEIPTSAHELTVERFFRFLKFEEANRPKFTIHDAPEWIELEQRNEEQAAEWLDFICQQLAVLCDADIQYFEYADSADVMFLYNNFVQMLNASMLDKTPKTAIVLNDVVHTTPNEDLKDRLNGLTVGQMRELAKVKRAYESKGAFEINHASLASVLQPVGKGWEPNQYTERLSALKQISLADFIGLSFFLITRLESYALTSQQFSIAEMIAQTKRQTQANREIIKAKSR